MKKCELCNSIAKMYCESDQASLCWDCDARVHTANFLVAKHLRTLLCHACQSPTPWTASGPRLGPTVSVCRACSSSTTTSTSDLHQNDRDRDDHDDTNDDDSDEDDQEEEEDDDDDDSDEDDGDNQVVPLASNKALPPSFSSSSSSDLENSLKRFPQRNLNDNPSSRIRIFSNRNDKIETSQRNGGYNKISSRTSC